MSTKSQLATNTQPSKIASLMFLMALNALLAWMEIGSLVIIALGVVICYLIT